METSHTEPIYLVTHGVAQYLLGCRSETTHLWQRNDRVVVKTRRGIEIGTILGPVENTSWIPQGRLGKILRKADLETETLYENQTRLAEKIREHAQQHLDQQNLPLVFLESEILLEGNECILHTLVWGSCSIDGILRQTEEHFGLKVRILDISQQPREEKQTCETCGSESGGCSSCGTESKGGCSSGSCSKGQVKSAEELTQYFQNLRTQLEQTSHRVSLSTTP